MRVIDAFRSGSRKGADCPLKSRWLHFWLHGTAVDTRERLKLAGKHGLEPWSPQTRGPRFEPALPDIDQIPSL